jgi:hypothetical protein
MTWHDGWPLLVMYPELHQVSGGIALSNPTGNFLFCKRNLWKRKLAFGLARVKPSFSGSVGDFFLPKNGF